jgi:hypothetical protein
VSNPDQPETETRNVTWWVSGYLTRDSRDSESDSISKSASALVIAFYSNYCRENAKFTKRQLNLVRLCRTPTQKTRDNRANGLYCGANVVPIENISIPDTAQSQTNRTFGLSFPSREASYHVDPLDRMYPLAAPGSCQVSATHW